VPLRLRLVQVAGDEGCANRFPRCPYFESFVGEYIHQGIPRKFEREFEGLNETAALKVGIFFLPAGIQELRHGSLIIRVTLLPPDVGCIAHNCRINVLQVMKMRRCRDKSTHVRPDTVH
jgi:hypothetical protein